MNKEFKVLCDPDTFINIGDQLIPVGQLSLEQAELVATQHPGRYVEIVKKNSVPAAPAVDAPTK